jgi:hypothetical protein
MVREEQYLGLALTPSRKRCVETIGFNQFADEAKFLQFGPYVPRAFGGCFPVFAIIHSIEGYKLLKLFNCTQSHCGSYGRNQPCVKKVSSDYRVMHPAYASHKGVD